MLFNQIFLYYYIIKVSPRLTLYRLKDKKGVGRLTSSDCLKNYTSEGYVGANVTENEKFSVTAH
jgi:hypothetical protein